MDRASFDRLFDMTDRTVIVTGGTRGIGRSLAEGFVLAGARVVVASRKADACEEAAEHLRGLGGQAIGGPVMGWVTDTYGARVGFLSGGLICAAAAMGVGLVLARAAGLRPQVNLRRGKGQPLVAFVPRGSVPATGDSSAVDKDRAPREDSAATADAAIDATDRDEPAATAGDTSGGTGSETAGTGTADSGTAGGKAGGAGGAAAQLSPVA